LHLVQLLLAPVASEPEFNGFPEQKPAAEVNPLRPSLAHADFSRKG